MSETSQFLLGGEKIASATFSTPGTVEGGTVCEPAPRIQQQRDFKTGDPLFWSDGNPRNQLVVTVQTGQRDPANPDDDGRRRIYVKGQMQKAVGEALRSVNASDVLVGGELFVRYDSNAPSTGAGLSPAKVYSVRYTPPPAATQGFWGKPEGAPAPAAQQYPPQQAPAPAGYAPQAAPAPSGWGQQGYPAPQAQAPQQQAPQAQAVPQASTYQQQSAQPVWPGVDAGPAPQWAQAPVADAPAAAQQQAPSQQAPGQPPANLSPEHLAALQAAGWTGLPQQ